MHPSDIPVFERLGNEKSLFDLNCLPACFWGPITSAKVVLLFLSPGLTDWDYRMSDTTEGQALYARMRKGLSSLPSREEHPGLWDWWTSRTRCFGLPPETLRQQIAILNIGAYHSKGFSAWQLLAALPSSRASLDWAQRELFPAAERGERIVICLRSPSYWGLSDDRLKGALYAPQTTRGGHMIKGSRRDHIVSVVRARLAGVAAPW